MIATRTDPARATRAVADRGATPAAETADPIDGATSRAAGARGAIDRQTNAILASVVPPRQPDRRRRRNPVTVHQSRIAPIVLRGGAKSHRRRLRVPSRS
jgi:hypothetical protein